jgi:hypothetical protein
MTLASLDMDGDGNGEILGSRRKAKTSGVFWLRYPRWDRHDIGANGREVMFAAMGDINGDGRTWRRPYGRTQWSGGNGLPSAGV